MRTPVLLALLLAAGDKPRLMTLPEMLKKMEASPVAYDLKTLDKAPEADPDWILATLYPQVVRPVEAPLVEVRGGRRVVRPAPCEAAAKAIDQAEVIFQSKHYDAAYALYEEAMAKAPRCHLAVAYRGDASFFAGDYAKALADYERALQLDPDDGAIYLFKSNALLRLDRKAEAADALRWSLALRPHNANVLQILSRAGPALGVRVEDVSFRPRGFARREGKAVGIYTDAERTWWMGFAACRGLWLGEPEHRKAQTGSAADAFSSQQEKECLGALLDAYEQLRKEKHASEPQLDRLRELVEAGDFGPWMIYELASRVDPQVVLTLPPEERKRVFEFVKRRVVVDLPASGSPPGR